jgi:homospermidine synthase
MTETHPVYGRIEGPIVIIGFGSIGKGTWPLIERHFDYDAEKLVVIEPDAGKPRTSCAGHRIAHVQAADAGELPRGAGRASGAGQGLLRQPPSTPPRSTHELCREIGALYIDTVAEPWAGFYFDKTLGPRKRTNYALRERGPRRRRVPAADGGLLLRRQSRHGLVVRQAGAAQRSPTDTGRDGRGAEDRAGWAR